MTRITYEIIEHDGGWSYKVGDVFSEPFPSHDAARRAAERAAHEQVLPGESTDIHTRTRMAAGTRNVRQVPTGRRRMSRAERGHRLALRPVGDDFSHRRRRRSIKRGVLLSTGADEIPGGEYSLTAVDPRALSSDWLPRVSVQKILSL